MISFQLNDMTCDHCVGTLTKALKSVDPMVKLRFDLAAHRVDIESGRVDLKAMVTHRFKLDEIEKAYDLFSHQRDGVLKVAITP